MKEAFILSHLGLGDNICMIGTAIFLSINYDIVYFVVKKKNADNMRLFFERYNNIILYIVEEDRDISPNAGFSLEKFKEITCNMSLFLSGMHCLGERKNIPDFPLSLYDHMGLDRSIFYNYFPNFDIIDYNLSDILEMNLPIVFCHDHSSTHSDDLLLKQNISIESNIVINPTYNMYPVHHRFYEIAQNYISLPLINYVPIIQHSDILIMFDSSFWCLTMHLQTKPTCKKYCYSRSTLTLSSYSKTDSSFIYLGI